MGLSYRAELCTGCQACQMACLDQRDIHPMAGETPLCRVESDPDRGPQWYRFLGCTQCGLCADACPTGCLKRTDQGLILADASICIGCRRCETVCPSGVIGFDSATGLVKKCDGCLGRVNAGLLPACVHTCPTGALIWTEESACNTTLPH